MDVQAQQKPIRAELRRAVQRVLDSGRYILGEQGRKFEEEFSRSHAARYALGTASGTHALHLSLAALRIGPGDEVVTTANSFVASAACISYTGAKPVFADIDPVTLNIDPEEVERRLTPRTKAILPVHLFGYPADLDPLLEIARRKGLALVEDCAQAHLAAYHGRPVGTFGDIGCFSFYPSKNLGGAGDAGAVTTGREDLYREMAVLRDLGRTPGKRYEHVRIGFNYRLDEIQAAVLRVKLRRLAAWTRQRRKLAALYRKLLRDLPLQLPPEDKEGTVHSYHLFVIQAQERDALAHYLQGRGIATGVYYPILIPFQPAYAHLGYKPGDFPKAEAASRKVLAIPLYETMGAASVRRVAAAIRSFYGKRLRD